MKKKKVVMILTVLIIFIVVGIVFATVTVNTSLPKIVKSGTVEIEKINLQLKDSEGNVGKEIADWEPGDVNLISWKVKNKGTSAVYTRNKIQIYWNEDVESENNIIFLYPANMTRSEITEDFKKGENSQYAIDITKGRITLDDGSIKQGIEYKFLGDVLDGSKTTGKSKEVNYNSKVNAVLTDDKNSSEDDVAFNIFFSPRTSYLFEGKSLTIKVVTEAMQFTDDGKAEWQIVDSATLGG